VNLYSINNSNGNGKGGDLDYDKEIVKD